MTPTQLMLNPPPTESATDWRDLQDTDVFLDVDRPASRPHVPALRLVEPVAERTYATDPGFMQRHRVGIVLGTGVLPFLLIPSFMLVDTPTARLVTDAQQAQFSNILDWAIVISIAVVALTLVSMRYVFRRRRRRTTVAALSHEPAGEPS